MLAGIAKELDSRKDQECAKDIDDEMEGTEQRRSDCDQDDARDQRPDDAPEQHAVLILNRHSERREDHQEDENIVDAERLLDEVAGRPLQPRLRALKDVHADIEGDGKPDPERTPGKRFPTPDLVRIAVKHTEVECEHDEDESDEQNPG